MSLRSAARTTVTFNTRPATRTHSALGTHHSALFSAPGPILARRAPILAPGSLPDRLHRPDRVRDGHSVPVVLCARVWGERDRGGGGGRDLLDHAVLLRASVGSDVRPRRAAAGDPPLAYGELRRLLPLRLRAQLCRSLHLENHLRHRG